MATVGSILASPESGWKRIEDSSDIFTYEGTWGTRNNTAYSNSTQRTQVPSVSGNKIKFKFLGKKLRIITSLYPTYASSVKITIDGNVEYFSVATGNGNMFIAYEKLDLPSTEHTVEVERIVKGTFSIDFVWDAIDVESNPVLEGVKMKKAVLKNPTTNQHYSLAEKTLIPLPSTSDKNMVLHGIEAGKEIQLDVGFNKINYPVENVVENKNSDGLFVRDLIEKPLSIKFE